jgi:hypothetical protein
MGCHQLLTDRCTAHIAATRRGPLQEFLLEVQTSSGGSGPADVSQIALILAQQLEQRRDDPAAQLTALRCGQGYCLWHLAAALVVARWDAVTGALLLCSSAGPWR